MSYQEHAHSINGVEGCMFARHVWPKSTRPERAIGLWSTQTWGATRYYKERGRSYRISVDMRFDDNCRNGHHTFSITGDIKESYGKYYREHSGGCIHEEIAKHFPELAPLIKWHLTSTDGPTHYIANTIYLASDRDYNGLRKGESRQIRNGKTGALAWIMQGQADRHFDGDAPPDETVTLKWEPWCRIGEGKERQLDAARSTAVWPEATDAELCAEPDVLRAALEARAPALLAAFRADMEACGFAWEAP
jgi:hypothetical protein